MRVWSLIGGRAGRVTPWACSGDGIDWEFFSLLEVTLDRGVIWLRCEYHMCGETVIPLHVFSTGFRESFDRLALNSHSQGKEASLFFQRVLTHFQRPMVRPFKAVKKRSSHPLFPIGTSAPKQAPCSPAHSRSLRFPYPPYLRISSSSRSNCL